MKRIDTANKSPDLFGAGKDGFRAGDRLAGVYPTDLSADWCNHVQEELAGAVEADGQALNAADRGQLARAIQSGRLASAAATGTADAITASYSPAVTALRDGMVLRVRPAAANTTATPTFTPAAGTIAPKAIVKGDDRPLVAGDIAGAGHWLALQYDQVLDKWVLLNPATGIRSASLHGQCRLVKDGADLRLLPHNGHRLVIAGESVAIPAAGVALSAAGLTPGTLYYIYAYDNAGTITLEASATGHSTHDGTGVEIKTGDPSRTLVGMARAVAGPAWADADGQRLVVSWFNRRRRPVRAGFSAQRSTSSTTPVELHAEIRIEFLCWADEVADVAHLGAVYNSGPNACYSAVGFDGVAPVGTIYGGGTLYMALNARGARQLSEGYHYATALGWTSSGTAYYGGAALNVLEGVIG